MYVFAGVDENYKNIDSIEEYFKLSSTIKLTNLHLYDERGVVKRYDTIYDILQNALVDNDIEFNKQLFSQVYQI